MDVPTLAELNIAVALPAVGLALWACLLLLLDLFIPREDKYATALLALAGVAVHFVVNLHMFRLPDGEHSAFGGMYAADGLTAFVNLTVLAAVFIAILLSYDYLRRTGIERGEYYPLILIAASGAMLMGAACDLAVLFVALELLSIPLYIISGLRRGDRASEESAIKYFLLGAFSSAFLVYGVALVYGATASTNINTIMGVISGGVLPNGTALDTGLLILGAGMMLVGLGFKVAVVPFHMWTPDVYQGAPTAVTGYMSVVAKVGGFAGLLRVFVIAFPALQGSSAAFWQDTVVLLAALTMILGNVVALVQRDVKRMLAYSSIAHAGYLMMGLAAAGSSELRETAVSAVLFYLLAYTFTNLGAFAVVIVVEHDDARSPQIDDFAGLGRSHPLSALAMALFLFSLTGLPPTAGMVGKFFLFRVTVEAGLGGLALVGLLTSLVSAFYYVRIIVKMYMEEGQLRLGAHRATPTWSYLGLAVALAALGTFALGLMPIDPIELVNVLLFMGTGG